MLILSSLMGCIDRPIIDEKRDADVGGTPSAVATSNLEEQGTTLGTSPVVMYMSPDETEHQYWRRIRASSQNDSVADFGAPEVLLVAVDGGSISRFATYSEGGSASRFSTFLGRAPFTGWYHIWVVGIERTCVDPMSRYRVRFEDIHLSGVPFDDTEAPRSEMLTAAPRIRETALGDFSNVDVAEALEEIHDRSNGMNGDIVAWMIDRKGDHLDLSCFGVGSVAPTFQIPSSVEAVKVHFQYAAPAWRHGTTYHTAWSDQGEYE